MQHVININTDLHTALRYGKTTALIGDAAPTIDVAGDIASKRGQTVRRDLALDGRLRPEAR